MAKQPTGGISPRLGIMPVSTSYTVTSHRQRQNSSSSRELSYVPRGLTEIAQAKQGEWQESDPFLKAANLSKVTLAAIGVRPQ